MRTRVFGIAVAAAALVCNSADGQSGQNKSVPNPQPATSAPQRTTASKTALSKTSPTNTRTNKTGTSSTRSKGHQSGKGRGHGHNSSGGVDVGVGIDVDLGGIGQRRAEPDPFAVPAERQPVIARTEEKPKTPKKPREVAKTDPFAGVQLTGEKAKEQSNPR
jgi:hypothetical protein